MEPITRDMYDIDPDAPNYDTYIVTTEDGKRYRIDFENDYDSTPDGDCYSESDKEAWHNDEWFYVGVIVTPLDVPENKQFELSDSLCGLEFDFPLNPAQEHNGVRYSSTDADYQIMLYPVPEMIYQVAESVKKYELKAATDTYINS